jgi:hypothetical protein
VRLGVPPHALSAALAALPEGADLFVDAAAGQIYARGAIDIAQLQQIAAAQGGYLAGVCGTWAGQALYAPPAAGLMGRIRERLGAGGRLNPGLLAFEPGTVNR